MKNDFNREWLVKKFEEIKRRTLRAMDQLDEDQLNWSPDPFSHNIPTLLRHIEENIIQRIKIGICKEELEDRKRDFSQVYMTKSSAEMLLINNLDYVIEIIKTMSEEQFEEEQDVRGKKRSNLDMLHQCAAHYSEHMGQILYIAKQCKKEKYISTSV